MPDFALKDTIKKLLLEVFNEDTLQETSRFSSHKEAVIPWISSLENGTFDGKPFSQYKIAFYSRYVSHFLGHYAEVSFQNLELALSAIPKEQFSKK